MCVLCFLMLCAWDGRIELESPVGGCAFNWEKTFTAHW